MVVGRKGGPGSSRLRILGSWLLEGLSRSL